MNIVAYFLFLVTGVAFGYAASGIWKGLPVLLPLALAAGAVFRNGLDGDIVVRLVVALILTGIGIAIGWVLDQRAAQRGHAAAT